MRARARVFFPLAGGPATTMPTVALIARCMCACACVLLFRRKFAVPLARARLQRAHALVQRVHNSPSSATLTMLALSSSRAAAARLACERAVALRRAHTVSLRHHESQCLPCCPQPHRRPLRLAVHNRLHPCSIDCGQRAPSESTPGYLQVSDEHDCLRCLPRFVARAPQVMLHCARRHRRNAYTPLSLLVLQALALLWLVDFQRWRLHLCLHR